MNTNLNIKLIISFFTLIIIGSTACKKEIVDPVINYYITFKSNDTSRFDNFNVLFSNTRAHQKDNEGEYIRTVYIDSKNITYDKNTSNKPIFLGSSSIGTDSIIAYDFIFANASILLNGDTIKPKPKEYYESNKSYTKIKLKPDEVIGIIFEIDLDSSIVELPNSEYKFYEKVNVLIQ